MRILRNYRWLALASSLLGASLVSVKLSAQPQPPEALLEEVKDAWRKRQDAVRSLRVTLNTKTVTPKGVLTGLFRASKGSDSAIPAQDTAHDGSGDISIDGKKIHVNMKGSCWDGEKRSFVPYRSESVFDGERFTNLIETEPGRPSAFTRKATDHSDGSELTFLPLLASVRGLEPTFVTRETALTNDIQVRRVLVNSRALVEVSRSRNESRGEGKLWLDPAQGYAIHRVEQYDRQGSLTMKITITNSQVAEAAVGWLPERWSCVLYGPGNKLFRQVDVVARSRELNASTDPDSFQITLPPGTRLTEEEGKNSQHSVIKPDGSKRLVLRSELTSSYEDLMQTNSGDLAPPPPASRSWWLVGLGILVLLGSAVAIFRSRFRRTPAGDASPT